MLVLVWFSFKFCLLVLIFVFFVESMFHLTAYGFIVKKSQSGTQGRKLEVEDEAQAMKECRLPI